MRIIKRALLTIALSHGVIASAFAQSMQDVDNFINTHSVPTYDCPGSEHIPMLDKYLQSEQVSLNDKRRLQVEKTHWQICMGNYEDARAQLQQLVSDVGFDTSTRAYANAQYQLGFILDVKEDPKRCDYYQRAESLALNRFEDIKLSAELGQITVCGEGPQASDEYKLGRLYALLERYSGGQDKAALAHIHNSIGLLYGAMGQNALAAEQYQKSYEMGLSVYNGSNLLATLISVVSAQFASGDFEQARKTIDELKRVNFEVNTPLSNVWLHLAESGYYYRTGDFDKLRDSLVRWQVFLSQINSSMHNGLHRWYSAALCLHDKDAECLRRFVEGENTQYKAFAKFAGGNKDYLKLHVDIQFFLGDLQQAQQQFERYVDLMSTKVAQQQTSGKVLGVANLHSEILTLEDKLAEAEKSRWWTVLALSILCVLATLVALLMYRHTHLRRRSYDPLTGLLNTRAVVGRIKRAAKPSSGLTNALALFDLDSFKGINSQFGETTWDVALQQVATTLKRVTRDQDIIGRLGADQFIVCLTNIEENTARTFFERMQQALEDTIKRQEGEEKLDLQSSMTIYVGTGHFADLEDILKDMQRALKTQVVQFNG